MNYGKRDKLKKGFTSLKQERSCFDAADRWLAKQEVKPVITRAELEKLRTSRGGFRRADLERLGVPWPPQKGWLKKLVGNEPFVLPHWENELPEGAYIFRKDKPGFRYHLKTEAGTLCNMQNSHCFRKLDAVSDVPHTGRKLCSICDWLRQKEEEREAWQRFEAF